MLGINKTESPIEEMFYQAMRLWMENESDRGIDLACQVQIDRYRADFMLRESGNDLLVVECDGHEWHEKTKEQAARDKSRDRTLLCDYGLPTLRYTGSEIFNDAQRCAGQALSAAHAIFGNIAWTEWCESAADRYALTVEASNGR